MADAARPTYSEKLLDPRWQRVRLEVLRKYDFRCWQCGSGDKTLHVHHRFYRRGAEPWDYDPDNELMALCKDCHTTAERRLDALRGLLGRASTEEIDIVIGLLKALFFRRDVIEPRIENLEEAEGFGHFFRASAREVMKSLDENHVAKSGRFERDLDEFIRTDEA